MQQGISSVDTSPLHIIPVQPPYSIVFRTYDGCSLLDTMESKGGNSELRSVTFTYVTAQNIREVSKFILALNKQLKILKMNIEPEGVHKQVKRNLIDSILSCTSLKYLGITDSSIMSEVLKGYSNSEDGLGQLSISCEVDNDVIGEAIIVSPFVKYLEVVSPQTEGGKIFLRNVAGASITGLTIDPSRFMDSGEAADVITTFQTMTCLRVRTADHLAAKRFFDAMASKKLTVLNVAIGCVATHAVAEGLKELRPKSVLFERPTDAMSIASVISVACGPATTSLSLSLVCEDDVASSRLAVALTRYRLRNLRLTFVSSTVKSIATMITHIKGCASLERFEIGRFGVRLIDDNVVEILDTIYETFEASTIGCIELISRKGWDGVDDYNGVDFSMLSTVAHCITKSKLSKITSKGISIEVFGKYYRKYL